MKHIQKILICILVLAANSCVKSGNKKDCWQAYDPVGASVPGLVVCDKTKAEAETQYPQYWFYNQDEAKYCWTGKNAQGKTFYLTNTPATMAERYKAYGGIEYHAVDCSSFCIWEAHDKAKSKTTGQYSPTKINFQVYSADSCTKIFMGRIIVLNETADSIYTREFVNKG